MSADALDAKLKELILTDPGLGYRALHSLLKKDYAFSDVGLKKVQQALPRIREEIQTDKASARVDEELLPGAPPLSEIQRSLSNGHYYSIPNDCLQIHELEGRGKGYLATREINAGEVMLFDRAFCCSPAGPSEFSNMMEQCEKQEGTEIFKQEFMTLTCGAHGDKGMLGKLQNNVFQCTRDPEFTALFLGVARFNHSCCPAAFVDCSRSQAVVRALRGISKGEEVLISYVPVSDSLEERAEKLSSKGFHCSCERCTEESLINPQFTVPCSCGKFCFSTQSDACVDQSCDACGSCFDQKAALLNLDGIKQANEFMTTSEAAQSDTRSLVNKLQPLKKLCVQGVRDGAPPAHRESLLLLNNLSNLHYFCAVNLNGQQRTAALIEFYACKEQLMSAYGLIHGRSKQRDVSYLLSLHRLLHNDMVSFSPPDASELLSLWQQQLSDSLLLQYGQKQLPPRLSPV